LSVERSRKHGPFDLRYSPIQRKAAPASLWRLGEDRTDWQGFLTRFFPGARRHDFDTLAAYEAYRNDGGGRRAGGPEVSAPAAAETERWEGAGGALPAGGRRTRMGKRPVGTRAV
jgi:hypothetical protein